VWSYNSTPLSFLTAWCVIKHWMSSWHST